MIYIIEVVFAIGMCFQSLFFLEVIIACIIAEHLYRAAGSCTVVPLAYVVTVSSRSGNRECRNVLQRLALIGIDNNAFYQSAIDIKEVYGKLVLHVLDSIVGEVRGGKGQRICILCLFKHGINGRANIIDECVVRTLVLCCERNGDFCITLVEYRADQIKGVDLFIIAVCSESGPLCLFIQNGGNLQDNLCTSCIVQHINNCFMVKQHGDVMRTIHTVLTDYNSEDLGVNLSCSQLKSRHNVCGSGQTSAVSNILAQVYFKYVINFLNVSIVRSQSKLSYIAGMCYSLGNCGSPTLECISALCIHGLEGGCNGRNAVVGNLNGIIDLTVNDKGNGCPQIRNIDGMRGCGSQCSSPTLECQGVQSSPCAFGNRKLIVRNFLCMGLVCNLESNSCGVFRYVGSVFSNCRQRGTEVYPTLKVQGVKQVQFVRQCGNLAVFEGLGIDCAEHVKGNGVLVCDLLNDHNGICCRHGGQLVAFLVKCSKGVAFFLKIREVRSKLSAVGQEALKQGGTLLIYEGNLIQVSNGYSHGNIGCDVTSGNPIAQCNASAVHNDGYVIQNVLDPCAGIICGAESKAKYAVALVGVCQLNVLELCRNLIVKQIDCFRCILICTLCLSGIGKFSLECSICINHTICNILCSCGADVQLGCNICYNIIIQRAVSQCIGILKLYQSSKIVEGNNLRQGINIVESEGCFLIQSGFGSICDQNIAKLLEQIKCGTCIFDLFKQCLLCIIHVFEILEQTLNNVCKLIVGQQIEQLVHFANGCTLADALYNSTLGFIGNVCAVESLRQNLSECTGNKNLNIQIAALIHNVIVGSNDRLCSIANQIKVATQCNVELDFAAGHTFCTQHYVIGCQNAVITNVRHITRRYGIYQQGVLQTCSRNDFAIVTCLNSIHQLNQLSNAVAFNCNDFITVHRYGIDLTIVDLHSTGVHECGQCLRIHTGTVSTNVTKHFADDLLVIACININIQGSHTGTERAVIYHLVFTVIHGKSVNLRNDLVNNVHNSAVDHNIIARSKQLGGIPLNVIACRYLHLASGDQLHMANLLTVDNSAVNLPGYDMHSVLLSILRVSRISLRLDGIDDLISGSAVLNSVYNLIDVTDYLVIDKHVVNHGIKLFLCFCLVVSAQDCICGFFERFVRCILLFNIVLQLVGSVGIILHAVVLVDEVDEGTQILACKRGQNRAFCSERGYSDYRGEHCQTQQCYKYSATKFCGLLHWSFPPIYINCFIKTWDM